MSKINSSNTPPSSASRTDWTRVDAMEHKDIDLSDIPEVSPEQFARAVARKGLKPATRKQQITLRIDEDVIAWFKQRGPGYQTHINALLRAYMKAHESDE